MRGGELSLSTCTGGGEYTTKKEKNCKSPHVDSITTQSMLMVADENSTEKLKRQRQALKTASVKSRMESIDSTLPSDLLRSVNQSRDKGASSGLTAVPLVDQGLVLNKQEFRDSLRLRYNMPLSDLPSKCVCGEKYIQSRRQDWTLRQGAFGLVELQHFLMSEQRMLTPSATR